MIGKWEWDKKKNNKLILTAWPWDHLYGVLVTKVSSDIWNIGCFYVPMCNILIDNSNNLPTDYGWWMKYSKNVIYAIKYLL